MNENDLLKHLSREIVLGKESSGKKGERILPFVNISGDFIACSGMRGDVLKLYQDPCGLKAGIFMLCLRGEMTASINLLQYCIRPGNFVSILPGSIIQHHNHTEDLQLGFIGFSSDFMGNINLLKPTMKFLSVMLENPVLPLPEQTAQWFRDYFELMGRATTLNPTRLHPEIVRSILNSVLYGIGFIYQAHTWDIPVVGRGEEIYRQLLRTVRMHYRKERSVAFYAGELNVSQQHLASTIKNVTGKTVSDLIAGMVVIDAKSQLKSTTLAIQQIADVLNFPDVSSFGKYFKRYVGMSPQKYRGN